MPDRVIQLREESFPMKACTKDVNRLKFYNSVSSMKASNNNLHINISDNVNF